MYLLDKEKIIKELNHKTINQILHYNVEDLRQDKLLCFITLEFLTEEIDKRIKEHRKKATSITSKLICLLDIIMKVYVEYHSLEIIVIKDDIYNKIIQFRKTYEKSNKEIDENDIRYLDDLNELLTSKEIKLFEGYEKEIVKEIVQDKDPKQILDLNSTIKDLKTDLKNTKDILKNVTRQKERLEQKIIQYPPLKEVKETKEKLVLLAEEKNKVENKILELNKKIKNLEDYVNVLEIDKEDLLKQNNTIEEFLISNNVVKKNKDINDYYNEIKKRKNEQDLIDNKILNLISVNDYTIKELISYLKKTHKNINKEMINESFNRLKKDYSILEKKLKDYEISYILGFNEDNSFKIDTKENYYEIIAISDLHITDNKSIENLNYIYDYALKNNVRTIFNLGDIFDPDISFPHFMNEDDQKIKRLEIFNSLIEYSIKNIPKDSSITNLIIGGNHDKIFYKSGIDSIKRLTDYRKDYINLGYDHSVIKIKNDKLGLHHFDRRISSTNFIDKFNTKEAELVGLLNSYYLNNDLNRKDITLDFLGHYHVSKLSENNSYIAVPSLNRDHIQNGAWRIKFFFDSNGKITNIVSIPLIVDKKVYESSSITFEKTKKR